MHIDEVDCGSFSTISRRQLFILTVLYFQVKHLEADEDPLHDEWSAFPSFSTCSYSLWWPVLTWFTKLVYPGPVTQRCLPHWKIHSFSLLLLCGKKCLISFSPRFVLDNMKNWKDGVCKTLESKMRGDRTSSIRLCNWTIRILSHEPGNYSPGTFLVFQRRLFCKIHPSSQLDTSHIALILLKKVWFKTSSINLNKFNPA